MVWGAKSKIMRKRSNQVDRLRLKEYAGNKNISEETDDLNLKRKTKMRVLIVEIQAKPEKAIELKALLLTLVELTGKEHGCVQYDLFAIQDQENTFCIFEKWSNQAALDKHLDQDYLQNFIARFDELLVEPPKFIGLTTLACSNVSVAKS